jgi:ubiquinone/menaquinone biosynthesis C-methylase UbiE
MEHEMRFSLVMNWLLKLLKNNIRTNQLQAILDALICGNNSAEGIIIPSYISETFSTLSIPNYICDALNLPFVEDSNNTIPEHLTSVFARIWNDVLTDEKSQSISVLEPACGSANDYRFLDAFGVSRLIGYRGFDLCEKNIRNAGMMFPDVDFKVGNILNILAEDDAFDYCFVHDLFEHLSLEAMECAMSEVCRVTRCGICMNFFNMYNGDKHIVKVIDSYHWNKLSLKEIKEFLQNKVSNVKTIHIDSFLSSTYDYNDTHNKNAFTFIINV